MVLYIDGGCSGNGQKDLAKRRMVAVVTDEFGNVLSESYGMGGSNNIAELLALRDALVWLQASAVTQPVEIRTDSSNNLAWGNNGKVGKSANDRERVLSIQQEIKALRQAGLLFRLVWLPREQNIAGHYIEQRHAL